MAYFDQYTWVRQAFGSTYPLLIACVSALDERLNADSSSWTILPSTKWRIMCIWLRCTSWQMRCLPFLHADFRCHRRHRLHFGIRHRCASCFSAQLEAVHLVVMTLQLLAVTGMHQKPLVPSCTRGSASVR